MACSARVAFPAIFLSMLLSGCNFEPTRYSATGTVTMDGAPASYVSVKFIPVSSGSLNGGSASTDATGQFKVGENGKNTGLPSGEYKVTFTQAVVKGKPTLAGGGGKKNPEETLPTEKEGVADEYRDPEKTPITAKISSGSNNFTFDIKAKK